MASFKFQRTLQKKKDIIEKLKEYKYKNCVMLTEIIMKPWSLVKQIFDSIREKKIFIDCVESVNFQRKNCRENIGQQYLPKHVLELK